MNEVMLSTEESFRIALGNLEENLRHTERDRMRAEGTQEFFLRKHSESIRKALKAVRAAKAVRGAAVIDGDLL